MKRLTKDIIINTAQNRFHEIQKIVEIVEFEVKIGWLEVHYCSAINHSLHEFIISSLRHVKFWEYQKSDQAEFENDLLNGQYVFLNNDEAVHKFQLLKNMFSKELANISNDLIPKDLTNFDQFKDIVLNYDEWNNTCITLVSNTQFKNIFFGHSE
jgi:hypothetical protein